MPQSYASRATALEAVAGGQAANDPFWLSLSGNHSAGVTQVTTDPGAPAPSSFLVGRLIGFDPYTTVGEQVAITAINGRTITLARATKFAHASTALVDPPASIQFYGGVADGSTDAHRYIQRLLVERRALGIGTVGSRAAIAQPVYLPAGSGGMAMKTSSSWPAGLVQPSVTALPGFAGWTRNAAVKWARAFGSFTATSGSSTITISGIEGLHAGGVAGDWVAFNDPYNEGMPSNLVSGKIYRLLTWNAGTGAMTIADHATPSTPIVMASAGKGYAWANMHNMGESNYSGIDLQVNSADLSGIQMVLQQQGQSNKLRCDIDVSGGTATAISIDGQFGIHYNIEANGSSTTQTSVEMKGAGVVLDFLTCNSAALGLRVHRPRARRHLCAARKLHQRHPA